MLMSSAKTILSMLILSRSLTTAKSNRNPSQKSDSLPYFFFRDYFRIYSSFVLCLINSLISRKILHHCIPNPDLSTFKTHDLSLLLLSTYYNTVMSALLGHSDLIHFPIQWEFSKVLNLLLNAYLHNFRDNKIMFSNRILPKNKEV